MIAKLTTPMLNLRFVVVFHQRSNFRDLYLTHAGKKCSIHNMWSVAGLFSLIFNHPSLTFLATTLKMVYAAKVYFSPGIRTAVDLRAFGSAGSVPSASSTRLCVWLLATFLPSFYILS